MRLRRRLELGTRKKRISINDDAGVYDGSCSSRRTWEWTVQFIFTNKGCREREDWRYQECRVLEAFEGVIVVVGNGAGVVGAARWGAEKERLVTPSNF